MKVFREIELKIKKLEKKIKDNQNPDQNVKSIQRQIIQLKNWANSLELQGRGSYMRLGMDGRPYFEFDRVGNFRMPVYKNIDKIGRAHV